MTRPVIIAFFDYFFPAVKAGGPSKSALGFAENLSNDFVIKVVTRNRDFGSTVPFQNLQFDRWNCMSDFFVFYGSSVGYFKLLLLHLRREKADFHYLNSIFSFWFSIVPIFLSLVSFFPCKTLVIAPRGELAWNARLNGRRKKQMYLNVLRYVIKHSNLRIIFHATAPHEVEDIRTVFGRDVNITLAENLRPRVTLPTFYVSGKSANALRVVFVSRVSRIKNLEFAVSSVLRSGSIVALDIYGFIEDHDYFRECMNLVPETEQYRIRYVRSLASEEVISTIAKYDLLLLPTKGENFGHVILESFLASRPVLISDLTPWRGLERMNCGRDLPLASADDFAFWLNRFSVMTQREHNEYCMGAFNMAGRYLGGINLEGYKKIFA